MIPSVYKFDDCRWDRGDKARTKDEGPDWKGDLLAFDPTVMQGLQCAPASLVQPLGLLFAQSGKVHLNSIPPSTAFPQFSNDALNTNRRTSK